MKNYFLNFDDKLLRTVLEVGRQAAKKKCAAYIVGGIVRDIILKRKNYDLDIVVEGDAIRLARDLAKKWGVKVTVYKKFGTASLKTSKGLRVDLATARRESYAHPGALPVVRPGSLKEDLLRRDFTVNAMAIAIGPEGFGRLTDEYGGLADLSKKAVRVLHKNSFIDDPTRILRAVRFEQRFSFKMERQTLLLMKAALRKGAPSNVKPPRYFTEFKKILCEEDPLNCLKRLHQLDGLCFLDPKLEVRIGDVGLLHKRIQKARKKSLYAQKDWWPVYFMGLLAKADGRVVKRVLERFPLTKNERRGIEQSRQSIDMVRSLSARSLRASQVFRILRPLTAEAVLYLRVVTSKVMVSQRIDRFLDRDIEVKLSINGDDLKAVGVASDRRMGRVLENILHLKIDKKVGTKQEELKAVLLSLKEF